MLHAPHFKIQWKTILLALLGTLLAAGVGVAQQLPTSRITAQVRPTALPPAKYKGIWEPVSYPDDVRLFDVFFVTADEGWVVGGRTELRGGIILHTSDGGTHWDNQYGDSQSSEGGVSHLRFLDATHGWAMQWTGSAARLLHTNDGKNWIASGAIEAHIRDYMFTSDTNGVAADGGQLLRTTDGGRRWVPVNQCEVSLLVEGLAHRTNCTWMRVQFLTPLVGYATGFSVVGVNGGRGLSFVVVGKTQDGGASWTLTPNELPNNAEDAFFIDENVGYVRVGYPDTGQLFKTTDGGQTWTGMATSPGDRLQFADPEVGWSLHYNKVAFTTDGGNRWNSREYPFPAHVATFSLPRRDRGYIVGDHGMIYRYRIVPLEYAAQGMIPAPLLSGIDSPLDSQVQQLAQQVQKLAQDAGVPAGTLTQDSGSASGPAGGGVSPSGAASLSSDGTANGPAATNTGSIELPGGISVPSPSSASMSGCPGVTGVTPSSGNSLTPATTSPGVTTTTAASSAGFSQDTTSTPSPTTPAPATSTGFVQDTSAASATVASVSATVPQFVSKYRNLNLLMTGFQVATQMPAAVQCLKQSFLALKGVRNPQAAMAAVTSIQGQVSGLVQMMRLAFQKPR